MRQVATWVAAQVLAICAGTLNSGAAVAAEVLQIPSRNFSDTEFLQGGADKAPPVMLTGRLAVPESEGPVPLVLLLHGSDGPANGSVWNWGNFLGSLGMATLKVDSYTGRGHSVIYTEQARVAEFAPVYDIYRAIEVIADDQRIDPEKIAVMGFSRGGIGALYSSMLRFQHLYGPSHATISATL